MNTELSELIKTRRIYKQLSQRELARKINVDNATISRIENGTIKKPTIDILIKLSSELEIDFSKLLNLSGYDENEIIKFMNIRQKAYNKEFIINNFNNEELEEYLTQDKNYDYIDIIKVLNGYKNGKLTAKKTIVLIHSCIPMEDPENNVIYQSEKGDIVLEYPFKS